MGLTETAAAALIGAVVGFVVAELRVLISDRRRRKSLVHSITYLQLSLLDELRKSDVGTLARQVAAAFAPGSEESADLVGAVMQFDPLREGIVNLMRDAFDSELAVQYEDAVDRLAKVEPVLAYRLKGRGAVADYQQWLDEVMVKVMRPELFRAEDPAPHDVRGAYELEVHRLATERISDDLNLTRQYLAKRHRREVDMAIAKLDEARNARVEPRFWELMEGVAATLSAGGHPELSTFLAAKKMAIHSEMSTSERV